MRNLYLTIGAIAACLMLQACEQPADRPAPTPLATAPEGSQEPPRPGNPGDGSVRCPGGDACPEANLRGRHGTAGREAGNDPSGRPLQLICDGTKTGPADPCPEGYVGRLMLEAALEQKGQVIVCRNGQDGCKPNSWAIVCPRGDLGCPMRTKD